MFAKSWAIPERAQPKKRPVVTKNGTFMPKRYKEWRTRMAQYLAIGHSVPFSDEVHLTVVFNSHSTEVTVTEADKTAPKYLRQTDIDNLIGGVMDALQESGVIINDRQITRVTAWMGETDA
jgi:Holliday junction resolvase RusA-like endonuclease